MEYVSLLNVILAAITLAVVCYFPLRDYRRRPKLILQPDKKERFTISNKEGYFGFTVENKGQNIAIDVCGEIGSNHTSTMPINWNNWFYRETYGPHHSEKIFQINIYPGSTNKRWFFVDGLERNKLTSGDRYEISVRLNWEYHGLKSKTEKFFLNYSTWEELKITPINP